MTEIIISKTETGKNDFYNLVFESGSPEKSNESTNGTNLKMAHKLILKEMSYQIKEETSFSNSSMIRGLLGCFMQNHGHGFCILQLSLCASPSGSFFFFSKLSEYFNT